MDAVLRLGYEPVRGFIETIGAMMLLLRKTIVAAFTPPYDYGPELVDQFLFALRLGWFPMILASLAFTYGPAGVEVGDFLNLLGAIDRLGGLFVIIVMRILRAPRSAVMAVPATPAMTIAHTSGANSRITMITNRPPSRSIAPSRLRKSPTSIPAGP